MHKEEIQIHIASTPDVTLHLDVDQSSTPAAAPGVPAVNFSVAWLFPNTKRCKWIVPGFQKHSQNIAGLNSTSYNSL